MCSFRGIVRKLQTLTLANSNPGSRRCMHACMFTASAGGRLRSRPSYTRWWEDAQRAAEMHRLVVIML